MASKGVACPAPFSQASGTDQRPVYCQISPARDSQDELDRVCLAQHETISVYVQPNYQWYRGGEPGMLTEEVKKTLRRAGAGRAVIAVSTHGNGEGHFRDYSVAESSFRWTPKKLWYGEQNFPGLRVLLEGCPATQVDVVISQCHGKVFADEMQALQGQMQNVKIHGLSYDKTQRQFLVKNTSLTGDWTLCTRNLHKQLAAWFEDTFGST